MKHLGTQVLETTRLILRRFELNDAEEIVDGYINQSEFLYYANKSNVTLKEIKLQLSKTLKKYEDNDYYDWVIVLKNNNKIIGSINLKSNTSADCVEFNYAIDNRYINNGYMTEALLAVKEFCLKN